MKKTAIILLALIVGLCLAHNAFAEQGKGKYMVILIGVDSGNVEQVLAADMLGSPDPNHPGAIILKSKKAKPHTNPDGTPAPPPNVISETTIVTKFAVSSPGCRYIWHPAGYYVKVCR